MALNRLLQSGQAPEDEAMGIAQGKYSFLAAADSKASSMKRKRKGGGGVGCKSELPKHIPRVTRPLSHPPTMSITGETSCLTTELTSSETHDLHSRGCTTTTTTTTWQRKGKASSSSSSPHFGLYVCIGTAACSRCYCCGCQHAADPPHFPTFPTRPEQQNLLHGT
jgi:hypothetical protein